MIAFLAQSALSTLVGLMFADMMRAKPQPERENVGSLQNALRYHAVRRMAGIGSEFSPQPHDPLDAAHSSVRVARGHLAPFDAVMAEESLRDLEAAINGFPGGITSGHRKATTMYSGSIGADLMFGADDSDILEALSVSGDGSSEIIGSEYDIVGAELIGAAARAGNPKAKAALAKIAMRNAGAVIKNDLKNRRRYPLGFVPTEVDAGDSATIPAAPQNLFRAERLVIPSDIAFDFGIQDIKVGNQSQFAQSVEVPGAVFTEVSIDTNVTFDTAEIGNQISILVRNKGTEDNLEFTAAALGTIAKA